MGLEYEAKTKLEDAQVRELVERLVAHRGWDARNPSEHSPTSVDDWGDAHRTAARCLRRAVTSG